MFIVKNTDDFIYNIACEMLNLELAEQVFVNVNGKLIYNKIDNNTICNKVTSNNTYNNKIYPSFTLNNSSYEFKSVCGIIFVNNFVDVNLFVDQLILAINSLEKKYNLSHNLFDYQSFSNSIATVRNVKNATTLSNKHSTFCNKLNIKRTFFFDSYPYSHSSRFSWYVLNQSFINDKNFFNPIDLINFKFCSIFYDVLNILPFPNLHYHSNFKINYDFFKQLNPKHSSNFLFNFQHLNFTQLCSFFRQHSDSLKSTDHFPIPHFMHNIHIHILLFSLLHSKPFPHKIIKNSTFNFDDPSSAHINTTILDFYNPGINFTFNTPIISSHHSIAPSITTSITTYIPTSTYNSFTKPTTTNYINICNKVTSNNTTNITDINNNDITTNHNNDTTDINNNTTSNTSNNTAISNTTDVNSNNTTDVNNNNICNKVTSSNAKTTIILDIEDYCFICNSKIYEQIYVLYHSIFPCKYSCKLCFLYTHSFCSFQHLFIINNYNSISSYLSTFRHLSPDLIKFISSITVDFSLKPLVDSDKYYFHSNNEYIIINNEYDYLYFHYLYDVHKKVIVIP